MFELLLMLSSIIIGLFLIVVIVVGCFYGASFCVGLLTDCDIDEAGKKVREFLDNLRGLVKKLWTKYKDKKANNNFAFEKSLCAKCEADIRLLIDEQRYQQHCAIAASGVDPLVFTRPGDDFNLWTIGNSVYYADDNERCRLESKLTHTAKELLGRYGYDTRVLKEWQVRDDLDMPVLVIYYAKTSKQKMILDDELASRSQKIVAKNTAVTDDTEDVDLF